MPRCAHDTVRVGASNTCRVLSVEYRAFERRANHLQVSVTLALSGTVIQNHNKATFTVIKF